MQQERYACFRGSPPTWIEHLNFRFLTTLFVCPEQPTWPCFVWVKISTKHPESNIEMGSLTCKNDTGTQHPMCTLRARQGPDFARVPHSNISQFEMVLHPQKEVLTRSIHDYLPFSLDIWLWKEQLTYNVFIMVSQFNKLYITMNYWIKMSRWNWTPNM